MEEADAVLRGRKPSLAADAADTIMGFREEDLVSPLLIEWEDLRVRAIGLDEAERLYGL